jgi:CheY-like chemotaxis protein
MARILTVEDDTELLEALSEELAEEGYEVVGVRSGEAALGKVASFAPDIIVSDIEMPGMDGYQLLDQVRKNHPEMADVPFVFLTGHSARDEQIKGKRAGVDDYLTKPVDFEHLLVTIGCRLGEIDRIRKLQEHQLVRLYTALSDGPGGKFAKRTGDAAAGAGAGAGGTLGIVARYPKLQSLSGAAGERFEGVCELISDRMAERAREVVGARDVVSPGPAGEIVVAFRDADRQTAEAKSRELYRALRDDLCGDRLSTLAGETKIGANILARALTISQSIFEAELSPDDMSERAQLEFAVRRFIAAMRDDERAVSDVMSSIEAGTRDMVVSSLVTPAGAELPIKFLDFDPPTLSKLKSSFALFGDSNAQRARHKADLLFLSLLKDNLERIPDTDIIVVDMHHDTLSTSDVRVEYITKFKELAEIASSRIMLNIRAVPANATAYAIDQLLKPLGGHIKRRSVEIKPEAVDQHVKWRLPVSCVVCACDEMRAVEPDPRDFQSLRHALSGLDAKLVLRGLGDMSEVKAWTRFGFDGYVTSSY